LEARKEFRLSVPEQLDSRTTIVEAFEAQHSTAQSRASPARPPTSPSPKAVRNPYCKAKRDWANDLLHNATTRGRHGRRQRIIPAQAGLINNTAGNVSGLSKPVLQQEHPGGPPFTPTRPRATPSTLKRAFPPITSTEIADCPRTNQGQVGPRQKRTQIQVSGMGMGSKVCPA
jgi:hypothetical protein